MKPKAICLVSGGIDSPVAAMLAAKKYSIIVLHFCHYPFYCKGSFEKALKILAELKGKVKYEKLIIVPWAPVLSEAMKGYREYLCILCRMSMLKAAEKLCLKEGARAIVTGEALAQKASQTLLNMAAETRMISIPVIRPLLGFDKAEIEKLAKRLGLWFEEHVGCCTATPSKPKTRADAAIAKRLFMELGLEEKINEVLQNAMEADSPEGLSLSKFLASQKGFK